uniref:Rapamycin-insensitive companion of mTOR domain-containing protein n=1 Tax=Meloidogyne incognita TaxID=6306 RepID=A0A914LVP8_MELIC
MFLRFLDKLLGECTSAELIKLVVVSLDYFPSLPRLDAEDGYYSRFLLENVLISSKNIAIRKWCTKFLGSFFTLNQHYASFQINFSWKWPLNLLFLKLSDTSPKVVNLTARILLRWLSLCPKDVLIEMREQLLRAKLETLGDAGILLEVFLFDADLDTMEVDKSKLLLEIASNSLNKWNDYFYIHYNEIIAEQIRRALINNDGTNFFCFKRSKNGDFARASGQLPTSVSTHKKQRVFPPPHLYGHLARSKVGQDLLKNRNIIGKLEGIICNFLQKGICVDQIDQVKGSLFALAQILANLPSFVIFPFSKYTQLLLECFLQQSNNSNNLLWLSIRGCAIWAINIAATSKNQLVIKTLFEFGWEFGESFNNFELKIDKNFLSSKNKFISNYFQNNNKNQKRIIERRKRIRSELINRGNLINIPQSNSLDSFFNNYNSTSKYFYTKQDSNSEEFCEKGAANILEEKEKHKITEKENNDLIDYRKFLAKIDNLDRQTEYYKEINNFNNFGHVILPKNISTIFGNIFNESKNKEEQSSCLENKKYLKFSINKKHCKFLCIFCSSPKKLNIEENEEKNEEKEKTENEIRQLIYQLATQFSNTEITIKLLRIYKENPEIFENRCLFSDVINFISDSKIISFGGRRLVYQLFWKALSN